MKEKGPCDCVNRAYSRKDAEQQRLFLSDTSIKNFTEIIRTIPK